MARKKLRTKDITRSQAYKSLHDRDHDKDGKHPEDKKKTKKRPRK